ncbi:calcium-binding protein [Sphingobium sp. HBC34]|uniref:Calcium-binding protein n=1 Tax=Sphingobium cyanobacteriorum TaxID=3063954 RepID=A0ABT8ZIB4_9SPHN|nr:calcium-binding protein [Sphingobium sp. HBC34]MDO7834268.1 calcium-binding protein [Sphingobium sp. HBC34]
MVGKRSSVAMGGAGNDLIYSTYQAYGGSGSDYIAGGEKIYGEDGDDELHAADQFGYSRGAYIFGGAGADRIFGGDYDDWMASGEFVAQNVSAYPDLSTEKDRLVGGAGNDVLSIGFGDDADGGDGFDTLYLSLGGASAGVTFNSIGITGAAPFLFSGSTIKNIEKLVYLRGSEFDDRLTIAVQADPIKVEAGAGNDIVEWESNSVNLSGGDGHDLFLAAGSGAIIDGGQGNDTVDYRKAAAGVTVSLLAGTGGAGDSLANVENVTGSAFDDILTGDFGINRIDGGTGADTMTGGAGDDTYYVDDAGDVVIENDGEGYDNIFASASVDASGNFVDYIYLTGSANANVTGNGLNNIIRANAGDNVLNGGAGIDQLSYSIATSGVTISLAAAGPQATGGSGTDTVSNFENIEGSLYSDHLTGDAGNNVIDGWHGGDTMAGLGGDDIFLVDHVLDNVVEVPGQGYDTIYSAVSYSLEGRDVEMLVLSGSGALNATGNASANTLIGNDDANMLDGKGGADLLVGEGGDDAYVVDGAGTRVIETAGEGYDSVRTSVDLNLSGQSIEAVRMLGTARVLVGGNVDSRIVGNDGVNLILAGAGDDRVFGGAGDDRIEGGAGRDYLDGGAGVDSLSYEHAAAGVVVSLGIDGAQNTRGAGVDAVTGFENIRGSAFADRLTGDDHGNVISGLDGADVMIGLLGDDVYYVDNAGDKVVEKVGGGYDTVFAVVDYRLVGNVEALTLTGRGNIDATGNGQDNVLTGNAGNNRLNGGAGADMMIGKGGDDIYHVASAGDVVVEQAGEGHDLVISSVAYTLGDHVEDLRFVGGENLVGHGNALANDMRGNAGSNTLWGGAGHDVLTGGAGGDNFVFDTALGADNVDRITDFSATDDHISLFRSAFGALGGENGSLAFGAFQTGAVALEADDRILFDSASGNIFYDADGSGAGAAVLFAQVTPGLTLSNVDFLVLG